MNTEKAEYTKYVRDLLSFPCPECATVGFMHPQRISVVATHEGHLIEATGDGTACSACNHTFMDGKLTEKIIREINRISLFKTSQYIEFSNEDGSIKKHTLN